MSNRISLLILFATIFAVSSSRGGDQDTRQIMLDPESNSTNPEVSGYDCGTLSLYNLLRLQDRIIDFNAFQASMPRGAHCSHSMIELLDVANRWGQALIGVRLPKSNYYPDRPTIVYIDRKPHGHYVVLRRVGHTGKLVQILDPSSDPVIVDASTLIESPEWTGFALVPVNPLRKWLFGLFGVGALIITYYIGKLIRSFFGGRKVIQTVNTVL